jgi:hypothetical protein
MIDHAAPPSAGAGRRDLRPGTDARRLVAPDGTTFTIRPLVGTDARGMVELCRTLPAVEWARRLGVVDAHDHGFVARAVSVATRGGWGLAAVVDAQEADGGHLAGEAHYELLADGAGELGLVVAPAWRDWLGPRLVDAILDAAATRGVADLEADVMRSDEWLQAVLSSRGHAVLPSDDWLSTRLVVGTQGGPPVWTGTSGARVVVEAPGGRWHAAGAARAAGMEVMVCAGPGGRGTRCPLTDGVPCPLVAGADVAVVSYPPHRSDWDELVATHRQIHPGVPVVVEGRAGRDVPEGVVALDMHDPAAVVDRVAELAAARVAARGAQG